MRGVGLYFTTIGLTIHFGIVGSIFLNDIFFFCLLYIYNSPSPFSILHFCKIENLRTVIVTADIHQGL